MPEPIVDPNAAPKVGDPPAPPGTKGEAAPGQPGDKPKEPETKKPETPEVTLDGEKVQKSGKLLKLLRDRQAENEKLKTELAAAKKPAAAKPGEAHPALQGLPTEKGADGKERVQWHGEWFSPEYVVAMHEQGVELAETREQMTAKERADQEAAWEAATERVLREFEEAAIAVVDDGVGKAFPKLTGEQRKLLTDMLVPYADAQLEQSDLTQLDEAGMRGLVERIAKGAVTKARDLFTLVAAGQAAGNVEAREQHRVMPDGTPGVGTETLTMEEWLKLSPAQRAAHRQRAQAAAEAARTPAA